MGYGAFSSGNIFLQVPLFVSCLVLYLAAARRYLKDEMPADDENYAESPFETFLDQVDIYLTAIENRLMSSVCRALAFLARTLGINVLLGFLCRTFAAIWKLVTIGISVQENATETTGVPLGQSAVLSPGQSAVLSPGQSAVEPPSGPIIGGSRAVRSAPVRPSCIDLFRQSRQHSGRIYSSWSSEENSREPNVSLSHGTHSINAAASSMEPISPGSSVSTLGSRASSSERGDDWYGFDIRRAREAQVPETIRRFSRPRSLLQGSNVPEHLILLRNLPEFSRDVPRAGTPVC